MVTIFVQGVGANLRQPVLASGPDLPTTLAGVSVSLQQSVSPQGPIPVPLLEVFPIKTCTSAQLTGCGFLTGITLQIPFEMGVFAGLGSNVAQLIVDQSGANGAAIELLPQVDKIQVLREGDTITTAMQAPSAARGIVTHADGCRVTNVAPAKPGETLVLGAVGLGNTTLALASGKATPASAPSAPVVLAFNYAPNADPRSLAEPGRPPFWAECLVQSSGCDPTPGQQASFQRADPGFCGLYQVNIVVPTPPAGLAPCNDAVLSNLTVSNRRIGSFDGAGICVAVAPQ